MQKSLGLLLGVWIACQACGGGDKPARSTADTAVDPCSDFELDIKKVWSDDTKVKVNASLMNQWGGSLGVDVARSKAESVTTNLDHIASDWVMLRRSACLDHFKRKIGSDAEYQTRVACFDRVLQRQRTVQTEILQNADLGSKSADALNADLNGCR